MRVSTWKHLWNQALPLYCVPVCLWLGCQAMATATETEDVSSTVTLVARDSAQDTLVKAVLEVDGELLTEAGSKAAPPVKHPFKAVGNFLYEERILDHQRRQAVRYYQQASAQVSVDQRPKNLDLRESRRYVTVDPLDKTDQFVSFQGPLTRDELELVELPGGSHIIDSLLPGREVKVGESWPVEDTTVARLLNLNTVNANDVEVKLLAIEGDQAKLELAGKVLGGLHGVSTEVRLKGKLTFDTQAQTLTWLALGIDEDRQIGLTLPGLKIKARLRLLRQDQTATQLSDQTIQEMVSGVAASAQPLELYPGSDHFALTHDRHWHLYRNRPDLVVMRRVIDNRMVGQVNIRPLPPLPVGQQTSLDEFKREVMTALADSTPQLVDAREAELPNKTRQLRVAVVGQVANVPIHWVYYLMAFDESRRVTSVFTTSGQDMEAFGAEDINLMNQLDLRPQSGQPAKEVAETAADAIAR